MGRKKKEKVEKKIVLPFGRYMRSNEAYTGNNAIKTLSKSLVLDRLPDVLYNNDEFEEFKWTRRWRVLEPVILDTKSTHLLYSDGVPWMEHVVDDKLEANVDDVIRIAGYDRGVTLLVENTSSKVHYLDLNGITEEDEVKDLLIDQYGVRYQELIDKSEGVVLDYTKDVVDELTADKLFRKFYRMVRTGNLSGILLNPDKPKVLTIYGLDRLNRYAAAIISAVSLYMRDRHFSGVIMTEQHSDKIPPKFVDEDIWETTDEGDFKRLSI